MNRRELAKALGVHYQTVSLWVRKGLPCEADGSYDIEKVRAWHATAVKRVLPRLGGPSRAKGPRVDTTREIAQKAAKEAKPTAPSNANGHAAPEPPSEAKLLDLRYARARAEKAEMEMATLRGEMVPRIDLEGRGIRRVAEMRRTVMGIGKRAAPLVLGVPTARQVQAIIDKIAYAALERFARGEDEDSAKPGRRA